MDIYDWAVDYKKKVLELIYADEHRNFGDSQAKRSHYQSEYEKLKTELSEAKIPKREE